MASVHLEVRTEQFAPDEILYVVDTRQSEHFEKLFAVAKRLGFEAVRLQHVNFGTVLGADGRPFKTRSGTSVGLESLLDEAVARAMTVVCDPQRAAKLDPPLSEAEQKEIADAVGHGAIKYADLSHHRTSDYKFDLEKMISLDGNTSAYVQYAYARVQGIMHKGGLDVAAIMQSTAAPQLTEPAERALAMLRGAGIDGAKLVDGVSAGRSIWRVQVGPVASAMVAELSARFAGLGFGQPQVVRD